MLVGIWSVGVKPADHVVRVEFVVVSYCVPCNKGIGYNQLRPIIKPEYKWATAHGSDSPKLLESARAQDSVCGLGKQYPRTGHPASQPAQPGKQEAGHLGSLSPISFVLHWTVRSRSVEKMYTCVSIKKILFNYTVPD